MAIWGHVSDRTRDTLLQNREELDAWLTAPMGVAAEADQALNKFLGG